jgi:hypothetical protein
MTLERQNVIAKLAGELPLPELLITTYMSIEAERCEQISIGNSETADELYDATLQLDRLLHRVYDINAGAVIEERTRRYEIERLQNKP